MKKCALIAFIRLALLLTTNSIFSQEILFNKVLPPEGKTFGRLVTAMVQDRNGYMWLASKAGLFRYDGYEMKVFLNNPADSNSLVSNSWETIAVDSSGKLWISARYMGLDRFDPSTGMVKHFRHHAKDPATICSDMTDALFVDRDNTLWIGTDSGLDHLDLGTGKFTHYRHSETDSTTISCNAIRAIYEDREGRFWIGTGNIYMGDRNEGGLNLMDRKTGKFIRYMHDPKNPHSLINNKVRAICEDSKGNFWIGTAGDGLHTMDRQRGTFQRHLYDPAHPGKLSRPAISKFYAARDHITFIKEDVFGAIWIGTSESGINYYNPAKNTITHYEDKKGGYEDVTSWAAYSSREGVLWISTWNGNLYRIITTELPYYTLPEGTVNSFYQDADRTLWMATDHGLVLQDSNGKKTKLLADKRVIALKADHSGQLWIGTNEGLYSFDQVKKTFTDYSKINKSLSKDSIICFAEDSKADIWAGSSTALYKVNKRTGTSTRYYLFDSKNVRWGSNGILSLLTDRDGKIWVGSFNAAGLLYLDALTGKFKRFLNGYDIFCLYEDKEGTVWAGTYQGLFGYNRTTKKFQLFVDSSSTGEINMVRQIIEDDERNLWVGTDEFFFKINRERNQCTARFDHNFGFVPTFLNWRTAYKGYDSKIYLSTQLGYHAFFPDQVSKRLKPPEILISEFHVLNQLVLPAKNGPLTEPLSLVNTIRLNYRQNIFSFDFASIDFNNPKGNKLHFMLENFDRDWNQSSYDRRAVYFKVPPGNYIFRIKSINKNGLWAERKINIIITPPWWSTWWFRIPAFIITVGLFYLLIRWRIHRKYQHQLEQSEKEKELAQLRRKTVELETQALRAQMNPHFIFNSLNSINRFILNNNKLQASEYLAKFSRLIRLILQNSQANLIPLESELEALQLYLELESLRFEQHFDFEIKVQEEIDTGALKVPPLLLQPFAENAIWHGLMHKKEKGHLNLNITEKEDSLLCLITDDGIGRKKASELKNRSGNTHHSMGMRITADRIALLKEHKMNDTCIIVNDLVLPDGSAGGTEVLLKIPTIYD